ncbi:MAG: DUF1540 domain-containing protein [Bacillota bacterium]
MPNQEIYCTVNTCHYWGQGNHCEADKILVMNDSAGDSGADRYDANMAATMIATPAQTCMQTCCKTFVNRDETTATKQADGVAKQGQSMYQGNEGRLY